MAVRGEWFTENGGGAIPGNRGLSPRHPINQAAEEDEDGAMTETVGRSNRRRIVGIFGRHSCRQQLIQKETHYQGRV
jgi:hypothetical protein